MTLRPLPVSLLVCVTLLGACRPSPDPQATASPAEPVMPTSPPADSFPATAEAADSTLQRLHDELASTPADPELQRLRAAAALATVQGDVEAGDYRLVPLLTELAGHERASVRATAVTLLGALLAGAGNGAVASAPTGDRERVGAQVETASAAVIGALGDDNESVRLAAVKALGHARHPQRTDALLARLDDPSPLVRFQALSLLHAEDGGTASGRVADAAQALLDDPDAQVRRLAQLIVDGTAP